MIQTERRERKDANPVFIDQEWILIRRVGCAAVLNDPETPRRELVADAMIQVQDAIREVLFRPMPGKGAVALLPGNHGRYSFRVEPSKEPPKLTPNDMLILKCTEQSFR